MLPEKKLPYFKAKDNHNADFYLPDPGLLAAVDVALELGMPLLVTGEPGTGKTQLAYYIAHTYGQGAADVLRFNTKTSSTSKDLLYKYDALAHFRDAQLKEEKLNAMQYVSFVALGKAIVDSAERRYVVLVDEIDKAPRDFPNDVLYEFEKLSFKVEEAAPEEARDWLQSHAQIQTDEQGFLYLKNLSKEEGEHESNRPILILTSNSEKNLPDAFLRRCIYYHIPFPDKQTLEKIIEQRIGLSDKFTKKVLQGAIDHFDEIREQRSLRKKPATAELISWVHELKRKGLDVNSALSTNSKPALREQLFGTYSLLAKTKEDLDRLRKSLRL